MLKTSVKYTFLITLAIQYFVIAGTLHEMLDIGLIQTLMGLSIFLAVIILQANILDILKSRSLDTLFFMNTTLFMTCLLLKESIVDNLIRDGVKKLGEEVNGK